MVRVVEDVFGTCRNPITHVSEKIRRFTLINKSNLSVQVITYGATITTLYAPDKNGKLADITLGFDDMHGYQTSSNPYIGGTIGRVCSRVGKGRYKYNDEEFEVSKNFLGKHQLHGGFLGFDKVVWEVDQIKPDGVRFLFKSQDGHEGYPGEVTAFITYTLSEDNCFKFNIEAKTTKPTPVNMTNHAYFNLAGHNAGKKAMAEHIVMIKAKQITGMDSETVPDGRIIDLNGHVLDLRQMTNVGAGLTKMSPLTGYDHNYILDWNKNALTFQAKAYHPGSGRLMEISSNQPCMHFYTSHNMPDVEKGDVATIIGKGGAKYNKHGSFCMETHWYPDAMNNSNFPNVILKPGEKYQHTCLFRFGVCKSNHSE